MSPRLLADYRAEAVSLDQLMALAITDDHATQEAASYDALTWQRSPHNLRDRLIERDNSPGMSRRKLLHVTQWLRIILHVTLSEAQMGTTHVNARVQKHRDALRMAGLRPVQIWVPDTRRPDFAEECRRQCLLVAQTDRADTAMQQFMDEALADVGGWTE